MATASHLPPSSGPDPVDANNEGIEREGRSAPARGSEERDTGGASVER